MSHLSSRLIRTSLAIVIIVALAAPVWAQPTMLAPDLRVRTVASGLNLPTSAAFISTNDMLVLEKNTGQVKRVGNGAVRSTVLDRAGNNASSDGRAPEDSRRAPFA